MHFAAHSGNLNFVLLALGERLLSAWLRLMVLDFGRETKPDLARELRASS